MYVCLTKRINKYILFLDFPPVSVSLFVFLLSLILSLSLSLCLFLSPLSPQFLSLSPYVCLFVFLLSSVSDDGLVSDLLTYPLIDQGNRASET